MRVASAVVPTRAGVIAMVVPIGFTAAALVWPAMWIPAVVLTLAAVAAVWLEGRSIRLPADQAIRIDTETAARVHRPCTLRLSLPASAVPPGGTVRVRLAWPEGWTETTPEAAAHAPRSGDRIGDPLQLELTFTGTPRKRGHAAFEPWCVDLMRSAPGLACRRIALAVEAIEVLPDAEPLRAFDRLARTRALGALGLHRQRRPGAGREFDQIREYVVGDDTRDIDWKASARANQLMVTQHRSERHRDVLIALDTGRMMGLVADGHPLVDRAVDAALLIARASRLQGDRVGLMVFDDRVRQTIRPSNRSYQQARVAEALAAAAAKPVYTDFRALAEEIQLRRFSRSLVILLTDTRDPQLAAELARVLPIIAARHRILVLSIRDLGLEAAASGRFPTDPSPSEPASARSRVGAVLAADRLLQERAAKLAGLRRRGVEVVSCEPGRLALTAVDRYLRARDRV